MRKNNYYVYICILGWVELKIIWKNFEGWSVNVFSFIIITEPKLKKTVIFSLMEIKMWQ